MPARAAMPPKLIKISNILPKFITTLVIGIAASATSCMLWSMHRKITLLDESIFSELRVGSRVLATFLSEMAQEVPNRDWAALTARTTRRLDSIDVLWVDRNALTAQPPTGLTVELLRRVETQGEACALVSNASGEDMGRCYSRLPNRGPLQGMIVATQATPTRGAEIKSLIVEFIFSTVILTLACTIVAAVGVRYFVVLPVRRLGEVVKRIAAGDLSARLMLHQRDEVGELGREINLMCEKLQAASERLAEEAEARINALEQLRHTERLTTLGRLASSMAHELGTPLNIISGRAQLMSSASSTPGVSENVRIISEQTSRMTKIIGNVLDYARQRQPQSTQVELLGLVRKAFSLMSLAAQRKRVRLELDSRSTALSVRGDPDRLLQVVINLILNAIQAMPNGGMITVGVRAEDHPAAEDPEGPSLHFACIHVQDQGIGIPPDALSRIFEPFFTTKTASEGTGLGLSIVSGIVREFGGSINVRSEVGRGSCFTVLLPREAAT